MLDTDLQGLQSELALLKSQLEAQRLEVAAAVEELTRAREAAHPGDGLGAMLSRILESERHEIQLGEKLAAVTVEYQAMRARAELERYRQQLQIADLEKQLALRDEEYQKLKSALQALTAEHAGCSSNPAAAPVENPANNERLKAQLESAERECAQLRRAMESSLALRLARSLPWLLRPVRALFAKQPHSPGVKP